VSRMTILVIAALLGTGVVAAIWFSTSPAIDDSGTAARIANLQDVVVSHRGLFKKATDEYTPKTKGRIDDLAVPAAELLRQLPGVDRVDASLTPKNPADRLIPIIRAEAGRPLTDREVDLLYQKFLLQLEIGQTPVIGNRTWRARRRKSGGRGSGTVQFHCNLQTPGHGHLRVPTRHAGAVAD
jgi:hypothetical protein